MPPFTGTRVNCISFILIAFIAPSTLGHLYDILRVDTVVSNGPRVPPDQLFTYVTGGVSQAFWRYINSTAFDDIKLISSSCRKALTTVKNGLHASSITAFEFVDAAGKSAPGFMRARMASFGDFDQCLSIDHEIDGLPMKGKYCAYDIQPLKNAPVNESIFSLDQVSVYENLPYIESICLPSECEIDESKLLLSNVVKPLGFKVAGDFNCETKESISIFNKIASLNSIQITAGVFFMLMITMVVSSTMIHLACKLNVLRLSDQLMSTLTKVSAITSTEKLFTASENTHMSLISDILKHSLVLGSACSHAFICLEIPLSFHFIRTHDTIKNALSDKLVSSLFTADSQLVAIPVIAGASLSMIAYPIALKRKFPPVAAFIQRFTRFIPPMFAMTICELLWPVFSNGPIYSRVANFVADKCTKHWWRNLLFINNYSIDTVDICGGSSYYISIDIQLFAYGCLIIALLAKNTSFAWKVCAASCVLSILNLMYKAIKYEVSACLLCSYSPLKMSEYLDHVHMATTSYVPAYTVGIFVGYLMVEKKAKEQFDYLTKNSIWIAPASFVSIYLIAILQIISSSTVDAFIAVVQRLVTPIAWASLLLLLNSLREYYPLGRPETCESSSPARSPEQVDSNGNKASSDKSNVIDNSETVETKKSFNLIKGCSRLLLPFYFTHYLVIRTIWYSQRNTFPTNLLATQSRAMACLLYCYVVAFLFQIVFLSPLESARRWLFSGKRKSD